MGFTQPHVEKYALMQLQTLLTHGLELRDELLLGPLLLLAPQGDAAGDDELVVVGVGHVEVVHQHDVGVLSRVEGEIKMKQALSEKGINRLPWSLT